jgi:predicted ATPase/DNA-binding winged helix-turn-helix (wHTH) protein
MDVIRIGPFVVYPGERLLCAGDKPVDVGARAFDLLLVLAESPGRLVTKTTLMERVWPRLVVDENNLPAQIASLRRVLGAGSIRTVPKFGYRLDLPVSRESPKAAETAPPASTAPPPAIRREPLGRFGPLVGRAADLAAIRDVLSRERLVTLVGAAGVGKSRLAREVVALEPPGAVAVFVPLEPIETIDHVPTAAALALGLSLADVEDRFRALMQAAENLDGLLVFDGAEHLADSLAAPLDEWMARAPCLRVLVTSQVPLGRVGESLYRLGSLPLADAVELFGQRAELAGQRFALGAAQAPIAQEICRKLDGNPLALELAAARVPAFGLKALLGHLDDRFRLLKMAARSDEPRHGVLQAAFDWSYSLLSPPEQRVFDRLGAFVGSFGLDAAARSVADEAIDEPAAIDCVGRLVDRSLVTMLPQEPARYVLLETARCYARARLDASGTADDADRRMAGSMLDVLDRAYADYWSADEVLWLHEYEADLDNVRAALEWARGHDATLAVALYGASWPLFVETDQQAQARAAHAEGVALLSDAIPKARLARFWEAVATYDTERQVDRARYAAEIAAQNHAATGDARSQYYAMLQLVLNWRDELPNARRALASARRLEEPDWPPRLLAHGAIVEGALLTTAGEYAEARAAYRRALDLALGVSERQALAATVCVVELDIASGSLAGALQLARPLAMSLRYSGRRETRQELLALLFSALLLAGELDEARAAGSDLCELAKKLDFGRLYVVLDAMALLAVETGRHELAARILATSDAAHVSHGQPQRRPAAQRIRAIVHKRLDASLGAGWSSRAALAFDPLDEEEACLRALGLRG